MPNVCAYLHQFRYRPPCRAPTLFYCSYLHYSTFISIEHIKGRYLILRTTFSLPVVLLGSRRSRQHKRRQAADNDVCEIDKNIEIKIKNSALPDEWKRAIVVPIYKRNDRSAFTKYRPISLTTVLGKQVEHVTAENLRQVWDKND